MALSPVKFVFHVFIQLLLLYVFWAMLTYYILQCFISVLNPVIKLEATYKQKCKAKDEEIASIRREMDVMYSRWRKQKENLESELKQVRREKSNYGDQCDKLENELKKMQPKISEFDEMSHEQKREVKIAQRKENVRPYMYIIM